MVSWHYGLPIFYILLYCFPIAYAFSKVGLRRLHAASSLTTGDNGRNNSHEMGNDSAKTIKTLGISNQASLSLSDPMIKIDDELL
mmetsp:Transcript_18433/g.22650  ORF Transcript_18433/g.22650 Transcript_18433/m.22650 type:complete len:85 (+) Transcript_18433:67-321(+)